jgi:hypothetical protein
MILETHANMCIIKKAWRQSMRIREFLVSTCGIRLA